MAASDKKLKKLSEETIYLGLGIASLAKGELEKVIAFVSKKGMPLTEGYAKTKRELIENGKKEFEVLKTFTRESLVSASRKLAETASTIEGKKKKQSSSKKK